MLCEIFMKYNDIQTNDETSNNVNDNANNETSNEINATINDETYRAFIFLKH